MALIYVTRAHVCDEPAEFEPLLFVSELKQASPKPQRFSNWFHEELRNKGRPETDLPLMGITDMAATIAPNR